MSVSLIDGQDLVSRLLPDDPALHSLRHGREKVRLATQDSHDAVFTVAPDQALNLQTRHAVAFYVAGLNKQPALADHYRRQLLEHSITEHRLQALEADDLAAVDDPRLQVILAYTRILTLAPEKGDRQALQRLLEQELEPAEVVGLAQLVAFLAFEARLLGGLSMIAQGAGQP